MNDTNSIVEATEKGFINTGKIKSSAYVLKPTSEMEKKLIDDIVSSGDLTGSKTEQLFNSLAERSGYKVLKGGKYGANNGFEFDRLPKEVQEAFINDPMNLQPLPKELNSSKGNKVETGTDGWKMYVKEGKEISARYRKYLSDKQTEMRVKVEEEIKRRGLR